MEEFKTRGAFPLKSKNQSDGEKNGPNVPKETERHQIHFFFWFD